MIAMRIGQLGRRMTGDNGSLQIDGVTSMRPVYVRPEALDQSRGRTRSRPRTRPLFEHERACRIRQLCVLPVLPGGQDLLLAVTDPPLRRDRFPQPLPEKKPRRKPRLRPAKIAAAESRFPAPAATPTIGPA
jgi:hypothetical protein